MYGNPFPLSLPSLSPFSSTLGTRNSHFFLIKKAILKIQVYLEGKDEKEVSLEEGLNNKPLLNISTHPTTLRSKKDYSQGNCFMFFHNFLLMKWKLCYVIVECGITKKSFGILSMLPKVSWKEGWEGANPSSYFICSRLGKGRVCVS